MRLDLLDAAQDLMHPDAPFIQFTYAVVPPIPAQSRRLHRARLEPGLAELPAGPRLGLPQALTLRSKLPNRSRKDCANRPRGPEPAGGSAS